MRSRQEILRSIPEDSEQFEDFVEGLIQEFEDVLLDLKTTAENFRNEIEDIYEKL